MPAYPRMNTNFSDAIYKFPALVKKIAEGWRKTIDQIAKEDWEEAGVAVLDIQQGPLADLIGQTKRLVQGLEALHDNFNMRAGMKNMPKVASSDDLPLKRELVQAAKANPALKPHVVRLLQASKGKTAEGDIQGATKKFLD